MTRAGGDTGDPALVYGKLLLITTQLASELLELVLEVLLARLSGNKRLAILGMLFTLNAS